MTVVIIIMGVVIAGLSALIFLLWQVLKNTLSALESIADIKSGKTPAKLKEAYDGQYYPATVIAQIQFDAPQQMTVADFSRYDMESRKGLVGFFICTQQSAADYYGDEIEMLEEDEANELFGRPAIFKDVLVYAPMEGMWTWKSEDGQL